MEAEAWTDEHKRLYATSLLPGFPWITVTSGEGTGTVVRRQVVPYDYTFKVFVKGRWVGKDLISVYSEEFPHHSRGYYQRCADLGRLQLISKQSQHQKGWGNVKRRKTKRNLSDSFRMEADVMPPTSAAAGATCVLQSGDLVLHTVHRHEIPVSIGVTGADPVELLAVKIKRFGVLAVHKPSGLPTHATGRYYYNSAVSMLEYVLAPVRLRAWLCEKNTLLQSLVDSSHITQEEEEELLQYYSETDSTALEVSPERAPRPCHRLDRVTSGVLLLGVSSPATSRISTALMRKTKHMEEATGALLAADRVGCMSESSIQSLADDALQANFGVRKYYLAKVAGDFSLSTCVPSASLAASSVKVDVVFSDIVNDCPQLKAAVRDFNTEKGRSGVLLASMSSETGGIDAHQAVTIVVPVPSASLPKESGASLLLCIPLTGRLHQIRQHLSQCGFPIVGDYTYGWGPGPSAKDERTESIYFDEQVLPPALQGCTAFVADNSDSCGEPLCYECAKRLPIAVLPSHQGDGSVCLHALSYVVSEEVLSTDTPEDGELRHIFSTARLPLWIHNT